MHHEEEGLPVFQDLSDVVLNFSKTVSLFTVFYHGGGTTPSAYEQDVINGDHLSTVGV